MKVGKLNVFSFCGLFNIVMGPNPCSCLASTLCIYGLMGGILIGLTFAMTDGIIKIIFSILVSVNTLLFIALCFSSPGIPLQII